MNALIIKKAKKIPKSNIYSKTKFHSKIFSRLSKGVSPF